MMFRPADTGAAITSWGTHGARRNWPRHTVRSPDRTAEDASALQTSPRIRARIAGLPRVLQRRPALERSVRLVLITWNADRTLIAHLIGKPIRPVFNDEALSMHTDVEAVAHAREAPLVIGFGGASFRLHVLWKTTTLATWLHRTSRVAAMVADVCSRVSLSPCSAGMTIPEPSRRKSPAGGRGGPRCRAHRFES